MHDIDVLINLSRLRLYHSWFGHMGSLLDAIHECFLGADPSDVNTAFEENLMAAGVLKVRFDALKADHLSKSLQDIVGERG